MELNREDYHVNTCIFSIAFFEQLGETLLVHATDWNRLDVSNPANGKLIIQRPKPQYGQSKTKPLHYLDYFHASLSVSPDNKRIADNGWVWHPLGLVTVWDLKIWLEVNVWESEDGASRREFFDRDYYWDGPLCWIDETTLAVWGEGDDDINLFNSVVLFDVVTGNRKGIFAGPPEGKFIFDNYLFVLYKEQLKGDWDLLPLRPEWNTINKQPPMHNLQGQRHAPTNSDSISVWNVESGERLLLDTSFCPVSYHPGAKTFLTILGEGKFQLSSLTSTE
jgi:hypothetical protein